MERLIIELKRKYPGLARRAKRGPLSAIRLFCLECMGGKQNEVTRCSASECSLFNFKFGTGVSAQKRKTSILDKQTLQGDGLGDKK